MKKKYLYNGNILTEDDIADGAKQSNLDIPTYLQKAGIKELSNTYNYNGKFLSPEDVLDGANQSKLNFDDYIQKAGILPSDEPSKKKESLASVGSQIFGNGSVVGAAGMSQLKSSPQSLSNVSPEIIDDPLGNLINSYKQQQQKASEDYTKASNEALSLGGLQGGGFARPQNLIDAKTKYEDATKKLNQATQNAYNKSFNTAKEARDYLQPIFDKNNGKLPEDNTTVKVAANRIQRQNEVENILNNSNSLEDATGKYFGYDFTKQSEAKQGKDLDTFLHLPEVQEAVSEKGGNLLHAYNVAKGTLPTTYPSYVANKVANKISQELEDKKLTSWFYSNPSEETVNKAIQSLKDKGDWTPSDEVVYQHSLQPQVQAGNTDKVIRTTDLMHNIGYGLYNAKEGIEGTGRDIINTLGGGFLDKNGNSIFQNLGLMEKEQDRTKTLQQQEYSQTQVTPSSFGRKLTAGGGQFLGFTVPMILGEAAGIPAQANAVMMFEGINKDEGRQLYPDNPLKQNAYTLLTTTFDAALFPMLGTSKAAQSLKNVFKKDAVSTIEDLATNKISQSEAEQSLMNKFGNYLKEVPTQNFKTANALTAFQLFHNGVKSLVGGRNFDLEDNMKEAINNYGNNFLSGTFLSGISALKNFAGGESSIGKTLREKADNPDETMQKIQDNPDMVENLQQAIKINESLKNRTDLSETQKDKLMGEGMKEFALNKKLKELPNKNLQSDIKEQIEKSQLTQQAILAGKNPDEVKTDNEIKLQRLHEDNAADNKKFDDQKKEIDNQLNELDGRTPENRPKIKILETKAQELEVNRKRTNEDYQRNIEKLSPKQPEAPLTEQPTVSGKEEDSGEVVIEFKNNRVLINGEDVGEGKFTKLKDGNVEIDKLYLSKENQKKGIGRKVIEKLFEQNPEAKKIVVYPLASSEPYWGRFAENVTKDGNFEITRDSFAKGKEKYFKSESLPTQEVKGEQTNEEATQNTKQAEEANTSNEELNKNIQTTEEGTGEPPKEPTDELPFGKQPTTGIAHDIREGRTYDTKSDKPLRGEGVTVEESIQHGNDLLKSGKEPQQVAEKFLQDPEKNISYNGISLVRAQNRVNVKATDDAQEKFGENSNEYKEALDKENKWYNEVVKPMQTEWSKIGQAQQGKTDIDTGTFTGLRRAKIQNTDRELSPKEIKEAKELAGKVKVLTKQVEDLKQKLTDTLDKNEKTDEPKLTFTEKAKKIADQFRKLKQKPFTFKDENGNDVPIQKMGIGWNDLVEFGAKAIEQTGKIADGIKAIVDKIKDEDWYKKLSDNDKERLEKDLSDYYSEKEDLVTRFADKKDNKFSPEDAKDIWQYARDNYLDKGQTFTDTIQKTAMDLGLKPQQIIDAISQPKGAKNITNEMYRINYERNRAIQKAKQWATKSHSTAVDKFFNIISSPFRSLATLGHGHALLFTHAATNLFDYRVTKKFLSLAARQFKIVYGKQKYYDQTVSALKNDPLYNIELRSGLAINPDTVYDDWQLANNFLKKLKIQGNKGFLILKMFRHELFKYEYNKLSDIEKADPQALKNLAQVVNHWTGTAGIKPSATGNAFIFAPNLIVSKWARLTTDPLKALVTLGNWKNASTEDKVASKIILRKSGRIAATYLAALAGNQALLSLSGYNQNINFTNPFKSDWLKFKTGGKTIDLSGGMQSVGQLLIGMGALPFKSGKDVANDYYGAKTADDVVKNEVSGYLRRTMSPFGGTVWDVLSHKDFEGNVLPFYSDKPRSGKQRLSYGQYIMEKMPIPIAEGYRDFHNQLIQDGVDKSLADKITGAFIVAGAGSAGIKIGNEPKERPSPFTEQQTKDPRVSWIYNEWKKELPNTVPTSEEITKEDEAFKDKLSTLPKEVQDNYQKQHTENLFDILGNIHDNGTVFVKHYHDSNGNPVSQVYLSPPKGDYDEKSLKKLTDSEQAQVLHLAQAEATSKTKKEMFNQ